MSKGSALLKVEGLKTYFSTEHGLVRAVDDVSFDVLTGETLGVVGESGCGKSVTAISILNMVPGPKGKIHGGKVLFYPEEGLPVEITSLEPHGRDMRSIRGNKVAMIFQDPMSALTPVYTIGQQIMEAIREHLALTKKQAKAHMIEMLSCVGIPAPEQRVDEYPHQLSGGMRQRACIAMALSCNPRLLIADEPTTALDVTIQAQIIDLIQDLQQEFNMSVMMITHDLGVIGEMADRVMVMYMGQVVEYATCEEIFYDPKHPYTKALLESIPRIGIKERLASIEGAVPNPYALPKGCYFAPRCPECMGICKIKSPPSFKIDTSRYVKCWLHDTKGEAADA